MKNILISIASVLTVYIPVFVIYLFAVEFINVVSGAFIVIGVWHSLNYVESVILKFIGDKNEKA